MQNLGAAIRCIAVAENRLVRSIVRNYTRGRNKRCTTLLSITLLSASALFRVFLTDYVLSSAHEVEKLFVRVAQRVIMYIDIC